MQRQELPAGLVEQILQPAAVTAQEPASSSEGDDLDIDTVWEKTRLATPTDLARWAAGESATGTGGEKKTGKPAPPPVSPRPAADEMDMDAPTVVMSPAQRKAAFSDPDQLVGRTLKQRFVLERRIAEGGMGVVYKARDLRREEVQDKEPWVAIKLLNDEFRHDRYAFMALQREAKKAQKLAHPNIINVYDFDRDGQYMLMTMELLEGESLHAFIQRHKKSPAKPWEIFRIVTGMGRALEHAHANHIVHADLKPANVFITREGVVKVLDFGIARAIRETVPEGEELTVFSANMTAALTPTYASCEMLEGQEPRPCDDVYALACITYELLTGRHPYDRKPANQAEKLKLRPARPRGLSARQWRGLSQGLALRREERTPTVSRFLAEVLPERRRAGGRGKWALLVSGVLALGALGVYLAPEQTDSPPRTGLRPLVPLSALPPADQQRVRDLLEIAEAHFMVQRYTDPPGGNAWAAYKQVLEIHPGNAEALRGLDRIATRYLELARAARQAGKLDKARAYVEAGLRVKPGHPDLMVLRNELKEK